MKPKSGSNPQRRSDAKPAIAVLDEAVSALRKAGPLTLLCYYMGTAPFILALLFFWAEMSVGAYAARRLPLAALGMAAAFIWMKCWQSVFAHRLLSQIGSVEAPRWNPGRVLRLAARQTAVQGTSLLVLPIAWMFVLPFAWVYAFYHQFSLEGAGTRGEPWRMALRRSWEQACLWPQQNHFGLGWLLLVWGVVFINVASALLMAPSLLKTLFGVETLFSQNLYSLLNTTVLMLAVGLTHLVVDPVIKAFYVLRSYYGKARFSGADLKAMLRRLRAVAVFILMGFCCLPGASASEAARAEMDRSIDRVLERPEYAWRAPRVVEEAAGGKSILGEFMDSVVAFLKGAIKPIFEWIEKVANWLDANWLRNRTGNSGENFDWLPSTTTLIYGLCGLVVLGAAWLIWRGWKNRRVAPAISAEAIPLVPDLRDEHLTADQLPEDRWMELASEMIAKGEYRLGLRAMYLAGLAHLGVRELLTVHRAKSNNDYRRELARRGRSRPELLAAFRQSVRSFERAWYGDHPVNQETVAQYAANLERIRAC